MRTSFLARTRQDRGPCYEMVGRTRGALLKSENAWQLFVSIRVPQLTLLRPSNEPTEYRPSGLNKARSYLGRRAWRRPASSPSTIFRRANRLPMRQLVRVGSCLVPFPDRRAAVFVSPMRPAGANAGAYIDRISEGRYLSGCHVIK